VDTNYANPARFLRWRACFHEFTISVKNILLNSCTRACTLARSLARDYVCTYVPYVDPRLG